MYADAGWFLDIPGFGPAAGGRPMRNIATTLQTAYNASFDAACMSQLLPGQVSTTWTWRQRHRDTSFGAPRAACSQATDTHAHACSRKLAAPAAD